MAVFRVSLLLEPVPQGIVNEVVAGVYEEIEQPRSDEDGGEGVRLVGGEHLAAGARYELTDGWTVTLGGWDRDGEIKFDTDLPDSQAAVRISNDADGPVALAGEGSTGRSGRNRVTWEGKADLAGWWGVSGKEPPVTVRLGHRFGKGGITLNCAPAEGRWKVDVRAEVCGRRLLRPVIGFTLLCARPWLSRRIRAAVARFEADWNAKAPGVVAQLSEGSALQQLERLLERHGHEYGDLAAQAQAEAELERRRQGRMTRHGDAPERLIE
jgi:hypothetical protein